MDPVEELNAPALEVLTEAVAELSAGETEVAVQQEVPSQQANVERETQEPEAMEHKATVAASEELPVESPADMMLDDSDMTDSEQVGATSAETELADSSEIQNPLDLSEPEDPFSGLYGLTGIRARASGDWLQAISGRNSYTLQMASFSTSEELVLEEYLQLLSLANLINHTYLCLISGTSRLSPQWLVIHGDFSGLSTARAYIDELPAYSRLYEPFVRNSSSVAFLNNSDTARIRESLGR